MIEFYNEDSSLVRWNILGNAVHCIITDPPYGVGFKSGFAATTEGKKYTKEIENDSTLDDAIETFRAVMPGAVSTLVDEADIYVFTQWTVMEAFRVELNALPGITVKNVLVWEKGWPGLGDLDGNWANSFELILYAKKGRRLIPERRSSIIAVDRPASSKMIHPTEKPTELLEILMRMSTDPGQVILDPFAGSASTLRAARNCGRSAIGFEKDPEFFLRAEKSLSQNSLFDI